MTAVVEWAGVVLGSGAVGSIVTNVFNRRKVKADAGKIDAEAAQTIATTAVTLVAPLQAQVTDLLDRVETLEAENTTTKSKLQLAIDHIRELRYWIRTHLPDKTPPASPSGLGV